MEDSSFVPDNYGGSTDFYLQNAARVPKNDPVPLVPILAGRRSTSGSSVRSPRRTTRRTSRRELFATLDHLSEDGSASTW